jgi:predicted enzyme related to lactoylglutathione lyase
MAKNLIQHIEWTTRDPKRLQDFYAGVFDWQFSDAMPGYTMINGVGGIFEAPDPQMPVGVTPYVNVADLGEAEAKIKAGKGVVYKSKQEVPGMGWFSIFADPDGNIMALWQRTPRRAAAPAKRAVKRVVKRRPASQKRSRATPKRRRSR